MKNHLLVILFALLFSSCDSFPSNESLLSQNEYDSLNKVSGLVIKKTFDTLKSTLVKTIADSGMSKAIQVCNLNAHALETMYSNDKIQVRRVSTKFRNQNNSPSTLEKDWIAKLQEQVSNKQEIKNTSVYKNGEFHFFKPIIMQPLCLSCHGDPQKDIQTEILKTIDSLYPSDLAKGFKNEEMRGLWHIIIKYTPQK
jgi:Protein of unknown function (DUF3365)